MLFESCLLTWSDKMLKFAINVVYNKLMSNVQVVLLYLLCVFFLFLFVTNNRVRNPAFILLVADFTYNVPKCSNPSASLGTISAAISSAWGVEGDGDIWTEGGDRSATIDATKQRPPPRHAPLASHFFMPPPRRTDYYNVSSLLPTDVCVFYLTAAAHTCN